MQNFFGVSCCPVLFQDLVIVMVGGSPPADQRLPLGRLDMVSGNGSGIVAFAQSDGREVYRVSDELASYSTPVIANVNANPIGFAFTRGGLLAFDPKAGKEYWLFPWRAPRLESVNAALPIVRGDEVLISECYDIGSAMLKITKSDYKVQWQDPPSRREQAMRAHWATPIEYKGYVYGCSGRNEPDSDLRCIRWSDGELMWTEDNRIRTSLLLIDDHFVVLNERGRMQLIQATSDAYRPVTEIDLSDSLGGFEAPFLDSPCWAAPIVANGLMYVRGANRVACFRLIPKSR
ncbi:MAG: PQQ-binding-like beta-propeller repeat protein [Pirellulaceae bacterium]